MKRRSAIALAVVAVVAVSAFLFFVPVIPVTVPKIVDCSSICSSVPPFGVNGYGSVTYVWFGVGGTYYSPDHFRILGTFVQ